MVYPYNALLGRRVINQFLAMIHHVYLCMKMSDPKGVITVYGDQSEARRLEVGMASGQRHIYVVEQDEPLPPQDSHNAPKYVLKVKPLKGVKQIVLLVDRSKQTIFTGCNLSQQWEEELLHFLRNNADVFAWSSKDIPGIDKAVAVHCMDVDPKVAPIKQRRCVWTEEKTTILKAEV